MAASSHRGLLLLRLWCVGGGGFLNTNKKRTLLLFGFAARFATKARSTGRRKVDEGAHAKCTASSPPSATKRQLQQPSERAATTQTHTFTNPHQRAKQPHKRHLSQPPERAPTAREATFSSHQCAQQLHTISSHQSAQQPQHCHLQQPPERANHTPSAATRACSNHSSATFSGHQSAQQPHTFSSHKSAQQPHWRQLQ
jgi:hypothetical protein